MCRFVGYVSKNPISLAKVIQEPKDSLIKQSHAAQGLGCLTVNADGVGVGWYDKKVRKQPGIYKSTQPAWNDSNLKHMVGMIESNCFVGHVRAATTGDVNIVNCHPFAMGEWLFVHNGALHGFSDFKRTLINSLDDDIFNQITGHTDSEHFFALVMQEMKNATPEAALNQAFKQIYSWQKKHDNEHFTRVNCILTNGSTMIATRYVSFPEAAPLSLFFAQREENGHAASYIASEPFDKGDDWQEVPRMHQVIVDKEGRHEVSEIVL